MEQIISRYQALIEDLNGDDFSLTNDQVASANALIGSAPSLSHLHARFATTRSDGTSSNRINEFISIFNNLDCEKKIILAQRLFNCDYKDRLLFYHFPRILIGSVYPKLNEYINFRDATYERILTPTGIRLVMERDQLKGKISPQVEYVLCEKPEDIQAGISACVLENHNKLLLWQMDKVETLIGDHSLLLFVKKTGEQVEIVILCSAGTAQNFLDSAAALLHRSFPSAHLYGLTLARQKNSHSCLMFARNDAREISKNPEEFINFVRSHSREDNPSRLYKVFDQLPDSMLKLSATRVAMAQIKDRNVLNQKKLLIDSNDREAADALVAHWRKLGVLITNTQAEGSTNVFANKQFARLEREILEKIFTEKK
ncbi:MAG: hypothetical protein Q8K75_07265 [Chlamydiales bacterium]|nr:hypothetical protein [Chlamydiales bacterium]